MKRLLTVITCLIVSFLAGSAKGIWAAPMEIPDASVTNNAFALDLFRVIVTKERGKNIFISPYSISTALTMTYAGARKNTAEEIAAVLHLTNSGEDVHRAFHILGRDIQQSRKEGCQLFVANALWGQKGYRLRKDFLDLIARYYAGGFKQVDFKEEPERSRETINHWVAKNTAEKIRELLKQGAIDKDTRLVLTNAIYFKGEWATVFAKESTRKMPFYVEPGKVVEVQMMSITNSNPHSVSEEQMIPLSGRQKRFLYAEPDDDLQMLELDYAGHDLSMVILLPRKRIDDLTDAINSETLDKWLSLLSSRVVDVYLPRFKFRSNYNLSGTLKSMGIYDAFDRDRADFSGMTGKKNMYLSGVIHQADIEVNEKGTEAAAATAVITRIRSSLKPEIEKPVTFRADHPFLFLIRHKPTNSILFMGRVMNPKGTENEN